MREKFLVPAIIIMLILSSQIAAASIPIDWSKVKRVNNKQDLAQYIETARRNGEEILPVILTNGLTVSANEFIKLCPSSLVSSERVSTDGKNTCMIYRIKDYPGTRVANAFFSGNTSWLSSDEMKLYNVAVDIRKKILKKKHKYKIQDAMELYYEIMNRTSYVNGNMNHQPRFVTAIGALVDGKANCQGYTDAFYMLGRMLGLNVGRISGTANNEPHQWNTITYSDGKTYFVDVTWGDDALSYTNRKNKLKSCIYFNAPVEIMQVTHSWDWSLAPENIQPSVDNRYSYMGNYWNGNLARVSNAETGLNLLAQKISAGKKWFSVMTPYDEKYNTFAKANPYFKKTLNATGKKIGKSCWLYVKPFGKYMFITADTWE